MIQNYQRVAMRAISSELGLSCGTRFSSDCDVKTAAENWLKGKGRDFYQDGLNKLVLRSDKCPNRFGGCVEKRLEGMPLTFLVYGPRGGQIG